MATTRVCVVGGAVTLFINGDKVAEDQYDGGGFKITGGKSGVSVTAQAKSVPGEVTFQIQQSGSPDQVVSRTLIQDDEGFCT